ncbi:MAG: hypothetical protein HYZ53_22760 [Planctomycetes bacterium]|nr:hypothetical protein [Planctomycetota bacterium]
MADEVPAQSAEEVARELADRLEAQGVEYAIGGAMALGQWGVPRGTLDVDLNLWTDPTRPSETAQLIGRLGCDFDGSALLRSFLDKGWGYAFRRGVHVDFYMPTRDLHASVLARRRRRPLLGRDAWFIAAEDLAVFKLILFRTKDRADLEALAVVQGPSLDAAYVRSWIARLTSPADLRVKAWDEMVATAEAVWQARATRLQADPPA